MAYITYGHFAPCECMYYLPPQARASKIHTTTYSKMERQDNLKSANVSQSEETPFALIMP
jgi:hypothetical protein